MEARLNEVEEIWQGNRWLYVVVGVLIGVLITPLLQRVTGDGYALAYDLIPETIGIIITVTLIDRLYERREAHRRIRELKDRLFSEITSTDNSTALRAVDHLARRGWLQEAIDSQRLGRVNLAGADLSYRRFGKRGVDFSKQALMDANFAKASLTGVIFDWSVADGSSFRESNISSATFKNANLENAVFVECRAIATDFSEATLIRANLRNGVFREADFSAADLTDADLTGAIFHERVIDDRVFGYGMTIGSAKFSDWTVLPDESAYDPELGLDQLERFTNPDHPDYWRSDFDGSPAYEGQS